MKILILSWIIRKHSNRQHLGTLDRLNEIDGVECFIYGRKELEPFQENLKEKFIELVNVHKPDVVIGYAGMYLIEQGNLFRDISNCLKCFIEVDYHDLIGKEQWYSDQKFDFMFYRNANDTSAIKVPGCWWPWSAPEDEFYTSENDRRNIIGFAGSHAHPLYTLRRAALQILESAGLIDNQGKNILRSEMNKGVWTNYNRYPEYVRSVTGFFTSTENRGPFAKTFESMASKTAVLSSPIINKDLLFGTKVCYAEYKYDLSDLVPQARRLLNDVAWRKTLIKNAYEQFLDKHTQKKRSVELYNNINNLLQGKEVIRRWGL